jgi:hypothetical protein
MDLQGAIIRKKIHNVMRGPKVKPAREDCSLQSVRQQILRKILSVCEGFHLKVYFYSYVGFSVADYKHRGLGFDSRALLRIFLRELGLERGPLSLVIG